MPEKAQGIAIPGPGTDTTTPDRTSSRAAMTLSVLLPNAVLIETAATRIVAEATNGSFALLPRHIDFVAPLVAGLLLVTRPDGHEIFVGIDEGTLVKCADDVLVATRRAVVDDDLARLRQTVAVSFRAHDEHEITTRSALARLETGIIRRFIELEDKP